MHVLLSGCLQNYIICMKYKTDIIWRNWLYPELSGISAWPWGWLTQWRAECPWNSRCFRFLKAVSSCFVFQVALVLLAFLTDRSLTDDFFSPRWFLDCWFSWSTSVRASWQRATHRIGNAPVQTHHRESQFLLWKLSKLKGVFCQFSGWLFCSDISTWSQDCEDFFPSERFHVDNIKECMDLCQVVCIQTEPISSF